MTPVESLLALYRVESPNPKLRYPVNTIEMSIELCARCYEDAPKNFTAATNNRLFSRDALIESVRARCMVVATQWSCRRPFIFAIVDEYEDDNETVALQSCVAYARTELLQLFPHIDIEGQRKFLHHVTLEFEKRYSLCN